MLDVSKKKKNNPELLRAVPLEQGKLPSNYEYVIDRLVCSDGVSRFGLGLICQCCGELTPAVFGTREEAYVALDEASKQLSAFEELNAALATVGARRRAS